MSENNGSKEWNAYKKQHFPFFYKCFGCAIALIILGFSKEEPTPNAKGLAVGTSILAVMLLIRLKKMREVYLYGHKIVATVTSIDKGFFYGKSANLETLLDDKKFHGVLYPTKEITLPGNPPIFVRG